MTKILLSVTIWLRKYQGRGGNYYTIGNAATLLGVLCSMGLFLIMDIIYSTNNFLFNRSILGIIIIISTITYWVIMPFYLMYQLKQKKIHLKYKAHLRILRIITYLGGIVFILLIYKSIST